jgi:hypothetical protein
MENVDAGTTFRLNPDAVGQALTLANLDWTDLKRGSHPDDGADCLYLEADVREYSAFLVTLAVQYRHVDGLLPLADRVQLQHAESGDTRFWFPGLQVRGV